MKRILLILLSINLFTFALAQSLTIKGKVSSTDGELLPGVNVRIKNATIGTITDFDGNYQLKANKGDILVFTYIGFKKYELKVGNQTSWNVELAPDQTDLDEVVVVAYGKAKRITMTGAVSGIQAREIRNVPTSSLQNALTGKLPGFFSQQSSGQPGKDASDFFIRGVSSLNSEGNKPLIIVDDVQYTYEQLSQINVNEIESISILKDASTTAIYGIKGANGVLVVKTRRGKEGKPQINVRLEEGIQTPVRTPDFLNSYNTAILVNEAYENDGMPRLFSKKDIMAFRDHTDPYGHPDVNWYDEIFKKNAFQENVNVDISGGSKRLRYFVSAGYFTQDGMVKDFGTKGNDVNSNYFYRRFNYRTNVDFDVTDNLNMRLDVSSRFMNINEPCNMNATGEIYDFSKMHPYSAPVLNPNGSYAYLRDTEGYKPTLNARLANEGYKRTRRNDNNILYGATWKMDFLTQGLAANFRVAYSSVDENYRQVHRGDYPTYYYNSSTNEYEINPNKKYDYGTYSVTSGTDQATKDVNIQASLNYAHVFNGDHDVNAMFLYNRQSTTNEKDAAVPNNFEGYTLTMGYKYKGKYLIDLNMAYNGTDRFGKNNRFGFFPAVGIGYAISEENFFKNVDWLKKNVQLLKIRASYGLVGSDVAAGNRYLYEQVYQENGNYPFGDYPADSPVIKEGDLGTPSVTWEKAKKFDVGLDMNLFNKVSFTIDYFLDKRYDQLVTRADVPLIIGIGYAPSNVARTTNQGFDGQIGYQDRFGEFDFNTSLVFSYAKNKVDFKAEAQQKYPWLAETGRPLNQPFGYKWIGYYTPEDIELINAAKEDPTIKAPAVPYTDIPVQAGDLKYADLNGDGSIDDFDKGAIGKPNLPTTTLGWSFGGYWKGFSFNVLFQGSFDYSFAINGTGIESFKSQFQPIHTGRWTLDRYKNGEEITFPRLTTNPSTINSASTYMSDFWLINAWYIRLKTIDLGYQLPKKVLPKYVDNIRFYVNAYNLLTFTGYDKYQQDPEIKTNTAGDAYMNQRVVNLGVQLTF
ncbi:SusC/RagA family TonB-linked outer membrane protein [Bacteroides xylanisolvens]|uniref:SusC/RagA family TonB-linked outer membrane protein n=1 Tax=Bacteroides xylanisolvens TaxID=371601 RepID=UPI0034A49611